MSAKSDHLRRAGNRAKSSFANEILSPGFNDKNRMLFPREGSVFFA